MSRLDGGHVDDAVQRPLAAQRRILWLGFVGLLLLIVLIGWDVARSLQRTLATNASLMKSFRERDQILDELRDNMNRSGAILRDYWSRSDVAKAESDRAELASARARAEELLNRYERLLQPGQKTMFAAMRTSARSYWDSLSRASELDAATRDVEGRSLRRTSIGPLRGEVLRLTTEINHLNQDQLDAGEGEIAAQQLRLRQRLIFASTLGVALGCVLAVLVMARIRRLEIEADDQYRKMALARRELRELAGRLEAAHEEERTRLSRELHDEVGQSMSALLMDLGKMESLLPPGEPAHTQLSAARRLAETNVKSVRNMALLLRPSMLDDLGLVAALKWQGRELSRRTGLKVGVDVDESADSLPDSHRTCIYRVVQEALNNCAKHSKATSVRVLVRPGPDGFELSVQDDGAGFDAATDKGLGILGIEERVARLGGALRLDSRRGEGTVLSVWLPVPKRESVA